MEAFVAYMLVGGIVLYLGQWVVINVVAAVEELLELLGKLFKIAAALTAMGFLLWLLVQAWS